MSESRPPGRPLDARREAALLDAALELLSEVGYERLSLTEVCRRAGASTKTVYRRWTNKDELMTAALRRAVVRAVDEPFEVVATGSLRGDLLENLRASARTQRQFTPQYMAGLLVAASSGSDAGRMARELFRVHYARLTETVLQWARERGEVGEDVDAGFVADLIRGVELNHVLVADGQLDDAFLESLVDRVLLPVLAPRR
ncbi:TetR/AcrR family transcriptional regulator [Streptomyces capitiformicae]|uniref:TetR/AcrR family transcriptional regulator n=1 Tax=Streptomyces capitiformicae TaxID=2014920 RepID=UPI00167613A5|nr:TetR/AcrR family transcriptional regulator [Streptomyces capitiformicae]